MFIEPTERFSEFAELQLEISGQSSICRNVPVGRVSVLPKSHCPLTGFTIRSLSHHLALCPPSELRAFWRKAPLKISAGKRLRLLLIPWPYSLAQESFYAVDSHYPKMPPGYGHFSFDPKGSRTPAESLPDLVKRLLNEAGARSQSMASSFQSSR